MSKNVRPRPCTFERSSSRCLGVSNERGGGCLDCRIFSCGRSVVRFWSKRTWKSAEGDYVENFKDFSKILYQNNNTISFWGHFWKKYFRILTRGDLRNLPGLRVPQFLLFRIFVNQFLDKRVFSTFYDILCITMHFHAIKSSIFTKMGDFLLNHLNCLKFSAPVEPKIGLFRPKTPPLAIGPLKFESWHQNSIKNYLRDLLLKIWTLFESLSVNSKLSSQSQ